MQSDLGVIQHDRESRHLTPFASESFSQEESGDRKTRRFEREEVQGGGSKRKREKSRREKL